MVATDFVFCPPKKRLLVAIRNSVKDWEGNLLVCIWPWYFEKHVSRKSHLHSLLRTRNSTIKKPSNKISGYFSQNPLEIFIWVHQRKITLKLLKMPDSWISSSRSFFNKRLFFFFFLNSEICLLKRIPYKYHKEVVFLNGEKRHEYVWNADPLV